MKSIFLFIILSSCISANAQTACPGNDINKVDLKNSKLEDMSFKNGKTFTKDDEAQSKPDWEITITKDQVFKPESKISLRVISLNRNHLTGSGSPNSFLVLQCTNNKLVAIFPLTDFNHLEVSKEKIDYEAQGEYLGSKGYAEGQKFTIKWDPSRKALQKMRSLPDSD